MKERCEIVEIIRPYLSQSTKKKYFFTSDDIHNTIDMIRKEGSQISINEVCRKLNCHKTFFRNKPNLKKIILKAKEENQKKVLSLLPKMGKFKELSLEAKQYEPIFIKYKIDLEQLGKNWRVAKTEVIAKNLLII